MPSVQSCTLNRYIAEAEADERNRGVYTLSYQIVTDGAMGAKALANEALSSSPHPLPSLWSTYSYLGDTDSYSYARKYRIKQRDKSGKLYDITVTFMPLEPGNNQNFADTNPLSRPPVVNWDREVYTDLVEKDINGNPILNKVNKRYDDPVEVERTRRVLVAEINVANMGYAFSHQLTYENAINSSNWDIFGNASVVVPQYAAICRVVDAHAQITEGGTTYFTELYRIAIKNSDEKPATWQRSILEQGFQYWTKDAHGTYEEDEDGNRALTDAGPEPILLDSDGTRLPDGGTAIFTNWTVNPTANFNAMPFMPLA